MIIVKLTGGFANQMFQYAFAKKAMIMTNTKLKFDIETFNENWALPHEKFGLCIFPKIAFEFSSKQENFFFKRKTLFRSSFLLKVFKFVFGYNVVKEEEFSYKPELLLKFRKNTYIDGYWQSEKYFNDIRQDLLSDFTFPLFEKNNLELSEVIQKSNSVSIHFRRCDYIKNEEHGVCSLEYYYNAINYITVNLENPMFYVFSDDITWVRENLKIEFPVKYIDWNTGDKSYNDMHLMSLCKHNIIANSSFSWWSAWLNQNLNKIVIAPKKWFNNRDWDTSNLIPSTWLQL
jgi:hypothetical protein